MIIVRLEGGLGNQMFQYAFGRRLAKKHGAELKLDLSSYSDDAPRNPRLSRRYYNLDIFNTIATIATKAEVDTLTRRTSRTSIDRILKRILGPKPNDVEESHYHFSKAMYELPDNVYVRGYWQSHRYFSNVEDDLRKEFTFKEEMNGPAKELQSRIKAGNSVCINVRRGDFVGNPLHDSVGIDYFYSARSIIAEKLKDYELFIFSDDIGWCKSNLRFAEHAEFVSHAYLGRGYQDYMRLIASCKHFVIPNSSFSWWAVWLNQDPGKIVIAPKAWVADPSWNTNDLYPAGWMRI